MLNLNTNWVSDAIKVLSEWWPVLKANFQAIQTAFNNHLTGAGERHTAQNIDYTGDMPGNNVKSALDNHIGAVSGSRHNAQDINYSGSVAGSNVKAAIDNLQGEIQNLSFTGSEHDALVTSALIDQEGEDFGPEGNETYLNGRLLKWEQKQLSHLSEMANKNKQLIKTLEKMFRGSATLIYGYGDSILKGTNYSIVGNVDPNPFPEYLQGLLRKIYNNSNITVVNKGVAGRQTDTALLQIDTDVIQHSPDLCIIMFGINDSRDIEGVTADVVSIMEYKDNLTQMINKCKKANIEVLLLSPTPTMEFAENNELVLYNIAALEVAENTNTAYIDTHKEFFTLLTNKSIDTTELFTADKIHLAEGKYKLIADILLKYMLSYNSIAQYIDNDKIYIPIGMNQFIQTNLTASNTYIKDKSTSLYLSNGMVGKYIIFNFYCDKSNLDLYVSSLCYRYSSIFNVLVDGVVKSINTMSDDDMVYNVPKLLIENISVGFHTIEFLSENFVSGNSLHLNGFYLLPTKSNNNMRWNDKSVPVLPVVELLRPIIKAPLSYKSGVTGTTMSGVVLLDFDFADVTGKTKLIIELEGKVADGTIITYCGNKYVNNANSGNSYSGVNAGNGIFIGSGEIDLIKFGLDNKWGTPTGVSPFSYTFVFSASHKIRIEHNFDAKTVVVYIDGTAINTYTYTDTNMSMSGYFGIGSYNSNLEIRIDKYSYAVI